MSEFVGIDPTQMTSPVQQIVAYLTLPNESASVRFVDAYSGGAKTAKAQLREAISLQWQQGVASGTTLDTTRFSALPVEVTGLFVFRSAARAFVQRRVYYNSLQNHPYYSYSLQFVDSVNDPPQVNNNMNIPLNQLVDLTALYAKATNSGTTFASTTDAGVGIGVFTPSTAQTPNVNWAPHGGGTGSAGALYYPGLDEGKTAFWLDALPIVPSSGDKAEAFINIAINWAAQFTAGDTWEYVIYQSTGKKFDIYAQGTNLTANNGGNEAVNALITENGYYAVAVRINAQKVDVNVRAPAIAAVTFVSFASDSFAHQYCQNFDPATVAGNDITALRMPSVAFILRNTATEFTNQGLLAVLQADAGEDWWWNYASAGTANTNAPGTGFFNFLFSRAGEQNRLLKKGNYSFMQPMNEHSFDFSNNIIQGQNRAQGFPQQFGFDIHTTQDFLVLGASTTNPQGGDCFLEVYQGIEFKTQNPLLDRQKPSFTKEDWEQAVQIVRSMRQHYDNPIHIPALLSQILGSVGKYAPLAANLAAMVPGVGGTIAGVLRGAGRVAGMLQDNDENNAREKRKAVEEVIQEEAGLRGGGKYRKIGNATAKKFARYAQYA